MNATWARHNDFLVNNINDKSQLPKLYVDGSIPFARSNTSSANDNPRDRKSALVHRRPSRYCAIAGLSGSASGKNERSPPVAAIGRPPIVRVPDAESAVS
jgi:hypothetical protein